MRPPFTTTWIEPTRILIGSIPTSPQDIETLKKLGIDSILTLTRAGLTCPGMSEVLRNVSYEHIPIPDGSIGSDDVMLSAVAYIAARINQKHSIYIHCRGGIGRSGTILIAYYVLYRKLSVAEARQIVSVRRNYEGNATAADQGSPQREWIDALPSFISRLTGVGP